MATPLPDEAPPLCSAKHGLLPCHLELDHTGLHEAVAATPDGMAEVMWADGCPHYREDPWLAALGEQRDEPLQAVYACAAPEDGIFHLDWLKN